MSVWWPRLAYPCAMLAAMGGAALAVAADIPGLAIYAIVSVISLGFVLYGEYRETFATQWHPTFKDNIRPDATLFAVNNFVLLSPVLQLAIAGALLQLAGGGLQVWPQHWPLWLQIVIALVVSEFGHYWWHRASHEWPLLWRFHQMHHSPSRLYWLNATRFHYIDVTLLQVAGALPLLLLGAGETVVLFVTLFSIFHGYWQHGNTRQTLGPLNYIFSSAELHRWHHNVDADTSNHNYGSNLIIWDLVFGSYFWPERGYGTAKTANQEIGVDDPGYPTSLWHQLYYPFKRK